MPNDSLIDHRLTRSVSDLTPPPRFPHFRMMTAELTHPSGEVLHCLRIEQDDDVIMIPLPSLERALETTIALEAIFTSSGAGKATVTLDARRKA